MQCLVQSRARDKHGNTPLHLLAKYGDLQTIRMFVDDNGDEDEDAGIGPGVESSGANLDRSEAVRNEGSTRARQLVELKAPTEAHNSPGQATPLATAGRDVRGYQITPGELIHAGADLEATNDDGNTSLHLAIIHHQEEVLSQLIEAGASLEALNICEECALHLAVKNKFTTAASKLLKAGAHIEVRDSNGDTPFSIALENGYGELCCELVRYGAQVDDSTSFFACFLNAAKANDLRLFGQLAEIASGNERNVSGLSALHIALSSRNPDLAKWVIEHASGDVSLACADRSGWTPLHAAAANVYFSSQARQELIKLLLEKGADPTAVSNDFATPVDIAKRCNYYSVVPILEKAELAHQLLKVGGEARPPDSVVVRFGGPPGAGKSTLKGDFSVSRDFAASFDTKVRQMKERPTCTSAPKG